MQGKKYRIMNEKERIEQLMQSEQMNAKQFAEEVGIQAGTLSNIVNERNKPSLEVLQRILNRFRMVSSDWLILGVGSMYRQKNDSQQVLFDLKPEDNNAEESVIERATTSIVAKNKPAPPMLEKQVRRIQKITVFYDDGTFEEILNS